MSSALSPSHGFQRFFESEGLFLELGLPGAVYIYYEILLTRTVGVGYGEWVRCFDKEKVTKIYGVEPNVDQHAKLRERVKEAGLEDVYVIVPVGVEDLEEKWVKRGEVDTIVTIQVCRP